MTKTFYIAIIIMFGFFLSPTSSYACGTKTEKTSCKKETVANSEKKDCCNDKHSKDKDNSCGGKCGHSNCTTSTVSFSLVSFNDFKFNNNNFDFSSEKQNFYISKTNISAGFYFIWLIPKIG